MSEYRGVGGKNVLKHEGIQVAAGTRGFFPIHRYAVTPIIVSQGEIVNDKLIWSEL